MRPKVLFFDMNETLLDIGPLKFGISKLFKGKRDLADLWFTSMLHYSLVLTVCGQYKDFWDVGVATLMMVAKNNSVSLSQSDAVEAVKPILSLDPFSDVMLSLKQLREAGYKLVSFTNSPERASQIQIKNAGISDLFDANISVQAIGKFKPHKDVYHWASKKMNVDDSDCMLIAAHGWDIAGALWAGWRGAFVARAGKQLFPLSLAPEINEPSLSGIVARLIRMKA